MLKINSLVKPVCMCMYVCTYVHIRVHIPVCLSVCLSVCLCVHLSVHWLFDLLVFSQLPLKAVQPQKFECTASSGQIYLKRIRTYIRSNNFIAEGFGLINCIKRELRVYTVDRSIDTTQSSWCWLCCVLKIKCLIVNNVYVARLQEFLLGRGHGTQNWCGRGSCYGVRLSGDVVEQSHNEGINCSQTFRPQGSLSVTEQLCDWQRPSRWKYLTLFISFNCSSSAPFN